MEPMVTSGSIKWGVKEMEAWKWKLLKGMLRVQENIQKYQRNVMVTPTNCSALCSGPNVVQVKGNGTTPSALTVNLL